MKLPESMVRDTLKAVLSSFIFEFSLLNRPALEFSQPEVCPWTLAIMTVGPWESLVTAIPKRGLGSLSGYYLMYSKTGSSFLGKIVVTPAK